MGGGIGRRCSVRLCKNFKSKRHGHVRCKSLPHETFIHQYSASGNTAVSKTEIWGSIPHAGANLVAFSESSIAKLWLIMVRAMLLSSCVRFLSAYMTQAVLLSLKATKQ